MLYLKSLSFKGIYVILPSIMKLKSSKGIKRGWSLSQLLIKISNPREDGLDSPEDFLGNPSQPVSIQYIIQLRFVRTLAFVAAVKSSSSSFHSLCRMALLQDTDASEQQHVSQVKSLFIVSMHVSFSYLVCPDLTHLLHLDKQSCPNGSMLQSRYFTLEYIGSVHVFRRVHVSTKN